MKKQFIIAGIILVVGLVLAGAGCGVQNDEQGNTQEEEQSPTTEQVQVEDTSQESVKVDPGVTKEELDNLKIDLESMEYEDLNEIKK